MNLMNRLNEIKEKVLNNITYQLINIRIIMIKIKLIIYWNIFIIRLPFSKWNIMKTIKKIKKLRLKDFINKIKLIKWYFIKSVPLGEAVRIVYEQTRLADIYFESIVTNINTLEKKMDYSFYQIYTHNDVFSGEYYNEYIFFLKEICPGSKIREHVSAMYAKDEWNGRGAGMKTYIKYSDLRKVIKRGKETARLLSLNYPYL